MSEEQRINLSWREEFGPVLAQYESIINDIGMAPNRYYVVVAILRMIRDDQNPTPVEVIAYIRSKFTEPPGGWGIKHPGAWHNQVTQTVALLR